jgi:hypothetical protein
VENQAGYDYWKFSPFLPPRIEKGVRQELLQAIEK